MKQVIKLFSHKKIYVLIALWWQCTLVAFSVVYFTPRDDLRTQLITLIQQERQSIHCAVYMFTDKKIAQALVDAHVRGVRVSVVIDQISMGEKYGKGVFLQNNGVSVAVFVPKMRFAFASPIMHHKFFVFGYNAEHKKSLIWTGSYNCTQSASSLHDENVIVTDDVAVINQYRECFTMLSERLQKTNL
ncbi:hypothetical protein KBD08_03875 [Candidatus Babeliales bacterium]|nr:hypothetical protein [Candidatus Babeliales bacterium]